MLRSIAAMQGVIVHQLFSMDSSSAHGYRLLGTRMTSAILQYAIVVVYTDLSSCINKYIGDIREAYVVYWFVLWSGMPKMWF